MNKQLFPVSELRKKAQKETMLRLSLQTGSEKIVRSIMGSNSQYQELIQDAQEKYNMALHYEETKKLNYLQTALLSLYQAEYRAAYDKISDVELPSLITRYETQYFNSIMELIESSIHNENRRNQMMTLIQEAILVLKEHNPKISSNYQLMLTRQQGLLQTADKLNEILAIPACEFTPNHSQTIKNLLSFNENHFKNSHGLKQLMFDKIRYRLDELLQDSEKQFQLQLECKNPSVLQVQNIVNRFAEIYSPLETLFPLQRYQDFIHKLEEYDSLLEFINYAYPELKTQFQYYSLPRRSVDYKKINQYYQLVQPLLEFENENYIEIRQLSPSIKQICSRFELLLSEHYKQELIQIYRLNNEIQNYQGKEKINEWVRFYKHLKQKIVDTDSSFIDMKLTDLSEKVKNELLHATDLQLLSVCKPDITSEQLIRSLEMVFAPIFDLGDIETIEKYQELQANLVKAKTEFIDLLQWFTNSYKNSTTSNYSADQQRLLAVLQQYYQLIQQYNLLPLGIYESQYQLLQQQLNSMKTDYSAFVLCDQFSLKNFVFFADSIVTIGREQNNHIPIPCEWISSKHCQFDFSSGLFEDNNSTNHSYFNSNPNPESKKELSEITTFCLAGVFEFAFHKYQNSYYFYLKSVQDKQWLTKNKQAEFLKQLYNTIFVYLEPQDIFVIQSHSMQPVEMPSDLNDHYLIKREADLFALGIGTSSFQKLSEQDEEVAERFSFQYR